MDELQLASRLAELTGSLSPAERTPPDALDRARRLLAHALLTPQIEAVADATGPDAVTSLDDLPEAALDAIRRVVHDVVPAPRDPSIRVFSRTWPLLSAHVQQSVPAWAAGWLPRESIGPFQSEDGRLVWFDVRRTQEFVMVVDAHLGHLLLALPRATLPAGPVAIGVTTLEIPAGSVWLSARLFDSSAVAGSLAGLRVLGGSLSLSQPGAIHGNVVGIGGGTVATLELRLDPGARRPRPPHGGDSRTLQVDGPQGATFAFTVGAPGGAGRLVRLAAASLEVYGTLLRLRHREGPPARYDSTLGRLWFPVEADRRRLRVEDARSEMFRPAGTAAITEAAWAVPVARSQTLGGGPLVLGEAAGAGALALTLANGFTAAVAPVQSPQPLPLEMATLLAEPGHLSVIGSSAPARYRRVLELWKNRAGRRSEIELRSGDPLLLRFDATTADGGSEALGLSSLQCTTQLDRPVTAAGARMPFFSTHATLDVFHSGDTRVYLAALADPPRDPISGREVPAAPVSIALTNALVGTAPPGALQVAGVLSGPRQVDRGALTLHFAMRFLMPSLPDPYAANIVRQAPRQLRDPASAGRGQRLTGRVRWADGASPDLAFTLVARGDVGLSHELVRLEDAPIQTEARRQRDYLPEVEDRYSRGTGQGPEVMRMLDVSSNADLFGVGLSAVLESRESRILPLHLRGLDLIAPVRNVSAFTLPAFQWEPVHNIPAEGALPFPSTLVSPTDGGATRFAAPAATLVPVAPLAVVATLLKEYNGQSRRLVVRFTLPFGMVAVTDMRRVADSLGVGISSPRFGQVRPEFPPAGLSGGLQLTLQTPPALAAPLGGPSPGLPGVTVQTDNGAGGHNVLKSGFVDETFNATFADAMKMVPVSRIDFSGYGASLFSDWRHPTVKGSGVTQVKFEAMAGRAAREVVQVRSKVYPWGAIVVRVITMERTGGGGVFRRDSGWQAASDATYDLPGCVVHPGVVPRLTNIRRIRDTANVFERAYPSGSVKLTQVVFDADVEIEGVTLGANGSRLVPTRDIVGYVQVLPVGADLTAEQMSDLLVNTGPIGAAIDCELNVAQSGWHMRLARIEVDRALSLGGNPQFVAVGRGTAELARAGQWTFAYRGPSEPELRRLETNRPIPLIRANPAGGAVAPYRIAEPGELHHPDDPESEYGLVHASGAQRLLVPRPQVRWGDATIHGGSALLFADMYALAGGIALFPRPDQCHPLPAGSALRITGRGAVRLVVPPQPGLASGEFKVGLGERTLAQGATLRVRSRFRPDATIRLLVDSDQHPDWSCSYGPVSTVGDINEMTDLMQVVGTVSSSAVAKTELRDPQMVFGSVLSPIQAVVDLLTMFGLPMPFGVALTNEKYAFKTSVQYKFPSFFPFSAIDDALKHGLGVMLELELKASFGKSDASFGTALSAEMPVASALSPWTFALEYEGKLLVKALSPLPVFLGGTSKFEIEGTTSGEESKLAFFAGAAGVVEADLKIVEVQGGRSYTLVSRVTREKGEVKLGMGYCSEWELEGEFLEGLVAVKLSFELLIILERGNEFHAQGEATLAIDVTLAWAFTKTFEVEFTMNEQLAVAAFVAGTVLRV